MIKHNNIFQVFVPHTADSDNLTEIIIEESYLISNGEMTPNYKPKKKRKNNLEVIIFPSMYKAAKHFHKEKYNQEKFINDYIDNEFCKMVLLLNPVYKAPTFIEYHFQKTKVEKELFLKHIKFVIKPLLKKTISEDKENKYVENEIIRELIDEWMDDKTKLKKKTNGYKKKTFKTNIENAENIIINNSSTITNQSTNPKTKKTIQVIALLVSVLMLIIALIINWSKIF